MLASAGGAGDNRRAMRILFICNRFPGHQRRGDQLRAMQHIQHLSRRHDITLLSFEQVPVTAAAFQHMQQCCEQVVMVRRALPGLLWRAALALPGRLPLQVAMFKQVPAALDLPQLLASGRFDLAHVQLVRLGPLLDRLQGLPVLLDMVDALSLNMRRRAAHDRPPVRWLAALEAARLARYERALCARVALAAVCAEADRQAIGVPAEQLRLLHNGVDPRQFPRRPASTGAASPELVFVGNLGYFPNIDGVLWFVEQVLPLLLRQRPDWRLRLVGARPAAVLRRLARRCAQVELVGEVDQVWPHLHRAAIAIAPLRAGSGQQLKVLEAMAAGVPVVSSVLGAAGLAAEHGVQLCIAIDAADMAAQISALFEQPEQAQAMADRAHQWVLQHHSWAASAAQLECLWQELQQRPSASASAQGG